MTNSNSHSSNSDPLGYLKDNIFIVVLPKDSGDPVSIARREFQAFKVYIWETL